MPLPPPRPKPGIYRLTSVAPYPEKYTFLGLDKPKILKLLPENYNWPRDATMVLAQNLSKIITPESFGKFTNPTRPLKHKKLFYYIVGNKYIIASEKLHEN